MSERLEETKQIVRSLVIPHQKGVGLDFLCKEYEEIEGEKLPYNELGFSSLTAFLKSIPDVVKMYGNNNNNDIHSVVLFSVADESTEHIVKMVSEQNKSKKAKKSPKNSFYSISRNTPNYKKKNKTENTPNYEMKNKTENIPNYTKIITENKNEEHNNQRSCSKPIHDNHYHPSDSFQPLSQSLNATKEIVNEEHNNQKSYSKPIHDNSLSIEPLLQFITAAKVKSMESTTSSSSPIELSSSPTLFTLSDWIRHKKDDFRPETRIKAFKTQAEQSLETDNFEDAIVFYTKIIELNPFDWSVFERRSYCYQKLHKYELSLSDAQKAIEFSDQCFRRTKIDKKEVNDYRNKLCFYRKGMALKSLKRYQEAIDALVESRKYAIRCLFIDLEIREIKINFIHDLSYDRKDIELICDKFNSLDDIIKQLNKNKESMITNDKDLKPTNPFKYRGLYVNGLVSDCDPIKFEELLRECGTILRCKVYNNDLQSKAIITFFEEESVRLAVETILTNEHLFRDKNQLIIRYRQTWIDSEKGSDPQINFKGNEIAGECYKWRTNGCNDNDCKLIHIPICHHLDQQNVETEKSESKPVKLKRTLIKFDIDLPPKEVKEDLRKNLNKRLKLDIDLEIIKKVATNMINDKIIVNRSLTSYDDLF